MGFLNRNIGYLSNQWTTKVVGKTSQAITNNVWAIFHIYGIARLICPTLKQVMVLDFLTLSNRGGEGMDFFVLSDNGNLRMLKFLTKSDKPIRMA